LKQTVTFLILVLFSSGCFLDATELDYTVEYQRISTDIGFTIQKSTDCGLFIDKIEVKPWGFVLLESVEDIDDLEMVEYSGSSTPTLEELFPEEGMLLVYCSWRPWSYLIAEHTVSHNASSIHIDEVRHISKTPHDPGSSCVLYAIQVVPD